MLVGQPLYVGSSALIYGTPVGIVPSPTDANVVMVLFLQSMQSVMVHAYSLGMDVTRPGRVVGVCVAAGLPVVVMAEA